MVRGINSAWRFGILLVVLLAGGIVVNAWEYLDEPRVVRTELRDFPGAIGEWRQLGVDDRFDKQTESVLRADDYLLRNYRSQDGRLASFYVGYYKTQRNGATYHSPLNCLPGSGWDMSNPKIVMITPTNGRTPFPANEYLIQNGKDRQLMVYWYQGRGRALASEYWGKVYTVWDSLRRRRSDGAMVRVSVPVGASESDAVKSAEALAASIATELPVFIPD